MSLMNLLRGVGDQFDFVPGFDPIKDKQGLLSQILSGSGRRAGGGMTPGAMPTAAPSYMPGAVESSPMPPVGMGRPLPGGAMMPTQAEPTAPPQWKNPVPAWQEFLLPTEFTDDRKAAALGKYNAEVAKYDAQQAAQQAAQERQARVSEGMSYGLTGKELLAYAAAPDKFGENLAERQGVMSAGQSFQDGSQTAYTAPSPFESKTDAFGRPLPFDPTTGGYGEAVGEAEPMDFGGYAVDPLTMGTLGDFRTPAQSGEMSEYQAGMLANDTARVNIAGTTASGAGARLLSPEEVKAAGYPEGAVVQVDAKGAHSVRYKPSAEYSAGAINDFRNKANVLSDFQRNLNAYKAAVQQDGTISVYGPNNKKAGNLDGLHQSLIFGAKDLLNLGILSKDDYENLNKLIPDATGRGTWGQGKDGFMAKLGPLEATITSQLGMIPEEFRGGTVGASAPVAPDSPQASALPPEAVKDLLADSSIEAQREFDEVFGQGAAQRALSQSGRAASRMTF